MLLLAGAPLGGELALTSVPPALADSHPPKGVVGVSAARCTALCDKTLGLNLVEE